MSHLTILFALLFLTGLCRTSLCRAQSASRREEVTFRSGNRTVTGMLTLPAARGAHPALVLLPADVSVKEKDYQDYDAQFARHGIAVLAYRGKPVGDAGNLLSPTVEDQAEDAQAGIRFLLRRSDIDAKQIGVWALGESALAAPLVVSHVPSLACLIVLSAVVVPPYDLQKNRLQTRIREASLSGTEATAALALFRQMDDVARTGSGYTGLQTAFLQARRRRWFSYLPVAQLPPQSSPFWKDFAQTMRYDPLPYWEKVRCPVLALYGGRDEPILLSDSRMRLIEALERGKNRDITVEVFPEADQKMFAPQRFTGDRSSPQSNSAAGYVDFTLRWLRKRITVTGSGAL